MRVPDEQGEKLFYQSPRRLDSEVLRDGIRQRVDFAADDGIEKRAFFSVSGVHFVEALGVGAHFFARGACPRGAFFAAVPAARAFFDHDEVAFEPKTDVDAAVGEHFDIVSEAVLSRAGVHRADGDEVVADFVLGALRPVFGGGAGLFERAVGDLWHQWAAASW